MCYICQQHGLLHRRQAVYQAARAGKILATQKQRSTEISHFHTDCRARSMRNYFSVPILCAYLRLRATLLRPPHPTYTLKHSQPRLPNHSTASRQLYLHTLSTSWCYLSTSRTTFYQPGAHTTHSPFQRSMQPPSPLPLLHVTLTRCHFVACRERLNWAKASKAQIKVV